MLKINNTIDRYRYLLEKKRPNEKVVSSVDFGTFFVFSTELKNINLKEKGPSIKASYKIEKDSGKISTFNPLSIDIKTYNDAIKHTFKAYK